MHQDDKNVTPVRQMSGRRSKPSMDLLVDNQRILKSYNIPKKDPIIDKHILNKKSPSNESEISSMSLKVKLRRESLRGQGITLPEQNQSTETINKRIITSKKIVNNKRKISYSKVVNSKPKIASPIINGSESVLKDINLSLIDDNFLSNLPYVTLKLNKIDLTSTVIALEKDDNPTTENDDIPLSKVFPDLKPLVTEVSEKGDSDTITRKRKLKITNVPKIKKSSSPIITDGDSSKSTSSKTNTLASSPIKVIKLKKLRVHNGISKHEFNDTESKAKSVVADINAAAKSQPSPETLSPVIEKVPQCIREKCTNVAIDDFQWDKEFCSPDCAIKHSKSLFGQWLIHRRAALQVLI